MRTLARAVEVTAHRGASMDAPEHTQQAYDLALAQGADALELDLRATADGELVVLHDPTLARTAGDPRPISAFRADDLAQLAPSVRPLRLVDVLSRYRGQTAFLLELKDPLPPMERRLVDAVRGGGVADDVVVQSFQVDGLRRIRTLDPGLPVAPLFRTVPDAPWRGRWLDETASLGAGAIGVQQLHVDAALVSAARQRGLAVRSWTVNDPVEVKRQLGLGVSGIITDSPGIVCSALVTASAA